MSLLKSHTKEDEKNLYKFVTEYYRLIDGRLVWSKSRGRAKVGSDVGSIRPDGYAHTVIFGRYYFMHHLVWLFFNKVLPTKHIDHIDGNPLNNSIENLRLADQWENRANAKPPKIRAIPMGVHKTQSGKYMAIYRNKHRGTFDKIEDAHSAYIDAKKTAICGHIFEERTA